MLIIRTLNLISVQYGTYLRDGAAPPYKAFYSTALHNDVKKDRMTLRSCSEGHLFALRTV